MISSEKYSAKVLPLNTKAQVTGRNIRESESSHQHRFSRPRGTLATLIPNTEGMMRNQRVGSFDWNWKDLTVQVACDPDFGTYLAGAQDPMADFFRKAEAFPPHYNHVFTDC